MDHVFTFDTFARHDHAFTDHVATASLTTSPTTSLVASNTAGAPLLAVFEKVGFAAPAPTLADSSHQIQPSNQQPLAQLLTRNLATLPRVRRRRPFSQLLFLRNCHCAGRAPGFPVRPTFRPLRVSRVPPRPPPFHSPRTAQPERCPLPNFSTAPDVFPAISGVPTRPRILQFQPKPARNLLNSHPPSLRPLAMLHTRFRTSRRKPPRHRHDFRLPWPRFHQRQQSWFR